jgi:HPt (histidine-containing phosphotransfer) domain-containing protein
VPVKISEVAENLGMEVDEIRELLELYVDTTRDDLAQLQAAVKANDMTKAHEKSHSIKGSSGNLTLTELYELAKDIDDSIRSNNIDGIESKIETFSLIFNAQAKEFE